MNVRVSRVVALSTEKGRRSRTVSGLAAAALVFTLSACGAQQEPAPQQAPQQADTPAAGATTQPGATQSPAAGGTDTASPGATGTAAAAPADADARNQGALAAIGTAAETAGGTAYEIDDQDDDGAWEVDVMVGNRSHEVEVGPDGTVQSQEDDDDMDSDDVERLNRANTTLEQAIEAALAEVPGTLDDVQLDSEDGVDIWEVSIDTADDDVEVYVATDDARIVAVDR